MALPGTPHPSAALWPVAGAKGCRLCAKRCILVPERDPKKCNLVQFGAVFFGQMGRFIRARRTLQGVYVFCSKDFSGALPWAGRPLDPWGATKAMATDCDWAAAAARYGRACAFAGRSLYYLARFIALGFAGGKADACGANALALGRGFAVEAFFGETRGIWFSEWNRIGRKGLEGFNGLSGLGGRIGWFRLLSFLNAGATWFGLGERAAAPLARSP